MNSNSHWNLFHSDYYILALEFGLEFRPFLFYRHENAIELDRMIGPIVHSRKIVVNHDSCVNCFLCEENCPVGAIMLEDGKVVLDDDMCIRCVECTNHCPVGALKRVEIE